MLSRIGACGLLLILVCNNTPANDKVITLPGTQPLAWEEADLSGRLMDAAHSFVERKIADAARKRHEFWRYDLSSREAYIASVSENREELKRILGVVDQNISTRMERYGDDDNPALVAETESYRVYQVRWPVLDGVFGEGLLAQPKGEPVGHVVVVPDAGSDPEQTLGLTAGIETQQQLARRLAENGFEVIVPQVLSHATWKTDDTQLARAAYNDREWIYRQAFHMGRHVIGYEIQRVLAAVDWFRIGRTANAKIAVAGYGEGGHIAFLAAAIDERIDVALVSGYFSPREEVWAEPIYRNVWSRLKRFGDAEIASLVLPRKLIVEHCRFPSVADHKGDIVTPNVERVRNEFDRIPSSAAIPPPALIAADDDGEPFSDAAIEVLAAACSATSAKPLAENAVQDSRRDAQAEISRRRQQAMRELERHVQSLVRNSEHVRDEIEFFQGGHSINGVGTFAFLHKHLQWPAPDETPASTGSKD